jgi:hypothetical protein
MGINTQLHIRKRIIYLITIILWSITLIYRVPFIEQEAPVYNSGHLFMLTTLEIWQHEHPASSNYAMKQTFLNEGDKHITYYKRYMDTNGNNYYVSHPNLALNVANLLIKLRIIPLSNAGLQWLTIFLHLFSLIVLTNLMLLLIHNSANALWLLFSVVGIYAFHHAIVHLHTLHYFAESLGQFIFILMLRQAYVYFFKKIYATYIDKILLGLCSFLFVSTEWLGICFIITVILYFSIHRKWSKKNIYGIVSLIAGASFAMLLFFFQHIYLNNIHSFVKALQIRFIERSGFFGVQYTDMGYSYSRLASFGLLLDKVWVLLSGVGLVCFVSIIIYFFVLKKAKIKEHKHLQAITILSALSCLLYLFLLFSATVTHYMYIAKWVLPASLFTGYVVWSLLSNFQKHIKQIRFVIFIFIVSGIIWSVNIFVKKAHQNMVYVPELTEFAEELKKHIASDEAICMIEPKTFPYSSVIYISYRLKRNMAYVSTVEEAYQLFAEAEKENGVIVVSDFETRSIDIFSIKNNTVKRVFF